MHFHILSVALFLSVTNCARLPDSKIIGGQDADIGEYPWMAEMYYFNLPTCAGTLISENHVLTAAQCVDGVFPEQVEIVLGMYDIFTQDEAQPETYLVADIQLNPDYVYDSSILNTTIAGDLAVITLSEGANMSNPFIDIVQLVPADSGDFVGEECTVVGWGRMEFVHPNELQEAVVFPHSVDTCKYAYDGTTYFVRDDMLCAGFNRTRGGCFGDAGAPLVCPVGESVLQVAVLSWLMPPCNEEYPTVMTTISTYRDWITEVTGV